ncbi:MAG: Ser-Thr-rich GPI-anchored membrane family protein, partial [Ignavibacteriaceae bacterium]
MGGNYVTVTSPNGGENWQVGSTQIITWMDNLTGNVEIQLFKNGIFHSSITGSTPSDGEYTWNIPGSLTQASDYSIRISSLDDGNISDFSDANFTLSNELIVTVPNGGESWQRGTSHTIRWTDNIPGNVKIDLYRDVNTFETQIASTTQSSGSYNWVIPAGTTPGSNYRIRITSVDNTSIFDISDTTFEIFAGSITISTPNGGENWVAGTSQDIFWEDNINENITIDLYKGGSFHSVISSSTGSDGSKGWEIPFTLESGSDYKVKITSVDNPAISDMSDSNFTIVGNQITVISPNGGEVWLDTDDHIITWSDNVTGNVEIQLYKNDIFNSSITGSTPSDGEYTWNIPGSSISGSDYKIKILSVDDGNVFDLSDNNFTIINNELTLTAPDGGESWLTETSQTITWIDDIDANVKLELFKDGNYNSTIATSTPSDGSYVWDIPPGITYNQNYSIKITSVEYSELFDMSNSNFTILTGNITVKQPNGGESWQAGTTRIVSWTDSLEEDVKIELYKGGSFHSVISS